MDWREGGGGAEGVGFEEGREIVETLSEFEVTKHQVGSWRGGGEGGGGRRWGKGDGGGEGNRGDAFHQVANVLEHLALKTNLLTLVFVVIADIRWPRDPGNLSVNPRMFVNSKLETSTHRYLHPEQPS